MITIITILCSESLALYG